MVNYPDDWQTKKTKKIATIKTGRRDTQDNKINGQFPFFVRSPIIERINFADYDCEAVLTAGDGVGTGKVFHYFQGKFSAHQRVYVMNDFDEVSGKFFYYYFSKYFYQQVEKYTAKSSVDSIRRDMIAEMDISYPALPEQKQIVEIIENFDTHVKNLSELIAKKKMIRDGAIEDLVTGKTRVTGFTQTWKNVSFAEVVIPKARIGWQGLKKDEYLRQGFSFLIGGTDFKDGTIDLSKIFYVSKDRYEMDTNIQVEQDDVLVTKDGTIGKVALVPELTKPATLNSGVFVFKTNKDLYSVFLYRILTSSIFKNFISVLSAGSTIKHLYQKDLKHLKFSIPVDLEEQKAIAEILTVMDKEIQDLEDEKLKIEQIREGALDDLLTGRVRLK